MKKMSEFQYLITFRNLNGELITIKYYRKATARSVFLALRKSGIAVTYKTEKRVR